GHMVLEEIGGSFKNGGTFAGRLAIPGGYGAKRAGERSVDLAGPGGGDRSDLSPPVARIEDRFRRARLLDAADDRRRRPLPAQRRGEGAAQIGQHRGMVQVESTRIPPRRAVK